MSHNHCCNNCCCGSRNYGYGGGYQNYGANSGFGGFGGLLIPLLLVGLLSSNSNRNRNY